MILLESQVAVSDLCCVSSEDWVAAIAGTGGLQDFQPVYLETSFLLPIFSLFSYGRAVLKFNQLLFDFAIKSRPARCLQRSTIFALKLYASCKTFRFYHPLPFRPGTNYQEVRMLANVRIKAIFTGSSLSRSKQQSRRILPNDREVRLFVYTADKAQGIVLLLLTSNRCLIEISLFPPVSSFSALPLLKENPSLVSDPRWSRWVQQFHFYFFTRSTISICLPAFAFFRSRPIVQ